MPALAKSMCLEPGCGALVSAGRCSAHRRQAARYSRGTTADRGYADGWPALRELKLATDPVCQIGLCCSGAVANEVDHIVPIERRPDLRLEWSNLQSACKPCNVAKTQRKQQENSRFVGAF